MSSEGVNFNPSIQLDGGGTLRSKQLDPLIQLISTRLQVSNYTAFRVLRNLMAGSSATTYNEIEQFLTKFLNESTSQRQVSELAGDLQNLQKKPETTEQNLRPIVDRLKYGLIQNREIRNQNPIKNSALNSQIAFDQDRFFGSNQARVLDANNLSDIVQSPRAFASWLVNNKAAFISLKANPNVTNLLIALQNSQINQSPVMLSQIAILISQLLRLKAGKSLTEDKDEIRKEKLDRMLQIEAHDHESGIVKNIKDTVAQGNLANLKDFLIEAERFAEEEIANLWSLALKKEKELEKKFKSELDKIRKKK